MLRYYLKKYKSEVLFNLSQFFFRTNNNKRSRDKLVMSIKV